MLDNMHIITNIVLYILTGIIGICSIGLYVCSILNCMQDPQIPFDYHLDNSSNKTNKKENE